MNTGLIAGVDIGGTHITASLVDPHTGSIVPGTLIRKAVQSQEAASVVINSWAPAIEAAYTHYPEANGHRRIGIAMPGPVDYEQGICYIKDQGKYDQLYGLNIKEMLAARLGVLPEHIRMMNDALCFLKGEIAGGAARGCKSVLGLTLGTGLGSAWFHHNKVVDADLWRMPFKGIIAEDLLASRWFVQRYALQSGLELANTKALVEKFSEDPCIGEIFDEFAGHLADFLETVLPSHPADVVVIGGNIAKSYRLFLPALEIALQQRNINLPIRIATLGEDAHIVGAAANWA
ncbi:ROK family protein [Pseudoflavitalea rhizosphaerae]|uniref:ROK family protein n=1 Tax=Pseudoflavitalea rhizosphaerae TaxID=1884793 RepID=UPI000F8D062D|nr:ROK family protein [Pseudoflavitalea rhizosphaerae]